MIRFDRLWLALAVAVAGLVFLVGCGGGGDDRPDGAALPSDFPSQQVPLVAGTVLTADGNRGDGWSVTVQGTRDAGNVLDAAVRTLTDNGFTESDRATEGGQRVVVLSGAKDGTTYWVQVGSTSGAAGGGSSVFYQVSVG